MTNPLFGFSEKHLPSALIKFGDEMVIVLKGHMLVEYHLDQILTKGLFFNDQVLYDSLDFSFSKKRLLAKQFLKNDEVEAIAAINSIRTKFAHNLDAQLSITDLKELIKIFQSTISTISCESKSPPDMRDLKLVFSLCVYGLLGRLGVVVDNPDRFKKIPNQLNYALKKEGP